MNVFLKRFLLLFLFSFFLSCNKDDNGGSVDLRDYQTQYETDLENIELFLKTYYMEVVNSPGSVTDQDVTFTKIPEGGTQVSIWNQTDYPLQFREVTVTQDDKEITYKLYYLKLREGSSVNSNRPCNVDEVLTSYNGKSLQLETETINGNTVNSIDYTQFEVVDNPQSFFSLPQLGVRGWSEIFPLFSTGDYVSNPDGTVSYSNFGAGVMFIPSGMAYYATARTGIPAYSPLVFSFKLYEIKRADQDGDGIPSYLEDLDGDGYMYVFDEDKTNMDDTDGDDIPDFLDVDDDGDNFTTASEIYNPLTDQPYPFNQIPTCSGGSLKRYLDPSCKGEQQ